MEIPVYRLAWSVELTCVPYYKQQIPNMCLAVLFGFQFHINTDMLIGCAASGF
jgi:hypothetical protein